MKGLASARSMIGDLERDTSMNEDEDDHDKIIVEEKQEDSSFIKTTTMTQVDFPNGYSISSRSRASSVIPEVTPASSEVAGLNTPHNTVDKTLCTLNGKSDKRKREKYNSKKKTTPRVDSGMDTFVSMQKESVVHCDAILRE